MCIRDRVNMLMAGASDYITKPFDIRELLARIAAQLRTSGPMPAAPSYELGRLRLDTMSHDVTYDDKHIRLTKTEYAILKFLMQNSGQVIAKSVILDRISCLLYTSCENPCEKQKLNVFIVDQYTYVLIYNIQSAYLVD